MASAVQASTVHGTASSRAGAHDLHDREQTEEFVRLLTGEPRSLMWWATFPDGEGDSSLAPQAFFATVDEVYEKLLEASDAGHGIFVAVNEADGAGRKTENIVRVRAVFADEDEKDGHPPVMADALSPPPTMVVRSGGGRHFYWRVTDAPLTVFTSAQRGIAAKLGTDPRICDLPRVMRCPGFPHLKDRSQPKPVFIEAASGEVHALETVLAGLGIETAAVVGKTHSGTNGGPRVLVSNALDRARAYLSTIRAKEGDGGDLQTFKACASALWDFALDRQTAWELVKEWNATNATPPWSEEDLGRKFASAERNGSHEFGAALISESSTRHTNAICIPEEQRYTDLGNARRFIEAARGRFLYVHGWTAWVRYDGTRWVRDAAKATHELAANVARALFDEAKTAPSLEQAAISKHAIRSQRRASIEAMVGLASSAFPDLKVSPTEFDADPDLLNVANGTIDLRTGALRPHSARDRLSRLVRVPYDPAAKAPAWERFLTEILPDEETRAFIQRAVGYSATGHVREHAVFFLYGKGRNGKGTFTHAISSVLGSYADVAPPGILLASRSERHPTDIIDLEGKRFVSSAETGQDREWNEERVKWLSGGDALKGRAMRENWRAPFTPTHKFWIESNHEPRVRGTDDGIWSRIKKIPFNAQWREATDDAPDRAHLPVQDTKLRDKLLAERPGILAWVVRGAQLWHANGLGVPPQVRAATETYRREQDVFADFLASYGFADASRDGEKVYLKTVVDAYAVFASLNDAEKLSPQAVSAELKRHGFDVTRSNRGRVVHARQPTRSPRGSE
jgi:putative DNA primase/helicase